MTPRNAHFYWSVKVFSLKVSCYMVHVESKESLLKMECLKHACFMHVSCMSQHISCAQIQKVSCMKFPVTILNSLKFHACYMHDSWNMHVTCRDLGVFQVWDMHVTCMDWCLNFMHVPCMKNVHISCMKLVCSRHIACVVQVYSKHDTGVFHAWYRCIPSMIYAYSMHGTDIFHARYWGIPFMCAPCTVQLQAY